MAITCFTNTFEVTAALTQARPSVLVTVGSRYIAGDGQVSKFRDLELLRYVEIGY